MAAISATAGENVGFYGVILFAEWRRRRATADAPAIRVATAVALATLTEFCAAEVLDSLLVRPLAMYWGPILTGDILTGTSLGKIMADGVFYGVAIVGYEFARRRDPIRIERARAIKWTKSERKADS